MAPTSITSTTTTPAEWEPHTAPTTTASPRSNANTTRTTPFGSTRTSLPDNSRRLKGHGDSATHLSGDREASGHSGGSRWGLSGSRVVLDGDPVSSLRQEPSMDQRGLGTSDASAPRLTRGEPRTRRGWLGNVLFYRATLVWASVPQCHLNLEWPAGAPDRSVDQIAPASFVITNRLAVAVVAAAVRSGYRPDRCAGQPRR